MDYQSQFLQQILSGLSESDPPAMQIYHANYIENGIRALSISFPSLVSLLGEQAFRAVSTNYLQQQAKSQFDWGEYGANFASFIATQERLEHLPYISEVAAFDWVRHCAARMPDIDYAPDTIAALDSEDLRHCQFVMAPAYSIHHFYFPVIELLEWQQGQVSTELMNKILDDAIKRASTRSVVVWRPEFKVAYSYLDASLEPASQALITKQSVEAVLARLTGVDLSAWLAEIITSKQLFSVRVTKPD